MSLSDGDTNSICRAIADTTRRRIIDELALRNRQSLFEIYARVVSQHGIGHSRQAFSRHLSVLEAVGIIEVEWQGTTKLHSLNTAPLARLLGGWLSRFEER
jgi:DNA-binding transcriptional ArsR family regulator